MTKLFAFDGLKRVDIEPAAAGDIVCLAGIDDITIGETVTHPRAPEADHADRDRRADGLDDLRRQHLAARRPRWPVRHVAHLRDRLAKELLGNVSIRVDYPDTPENLKVLGRGELELAILIEMMRRESFELQVSRPEIVTKDTPEGRMEPVEDVVIDVQRNSRAP